MVEPAEELQVAVGRPPGQIARPVQPRAGAGRTGRARSAPRSAPAAPSSREPRPRPPMYSSPGHADGHGLQRADRARRARCWRSAGRSAPAGRQSSFGPRRRSHHDGRFGRAVLVDEKRAGAAVRQRQRRPAAPRRRSQTMCSAPGELLGASCCRGRLEGRLAARLEPCSTRSAFPTGARVAVSRPRRRRSGRPAAA